MTPVIFSTSDKPEPPENPEPPVTTSQVIPTKSIKITKSLSKRLTLVSSMVYNTVKQLGHHQCTAPIKKHW